MTHFEENMMVEDDIIVVYDSSRSSSGRFFLDKNIIDVCEFSRLNVTVRLFNSSILY